MKLRTGAALSAGALLFCLIAGDAPRSQNAVCPDMPPGDSSNACADTRFVQNAAAALNAISGLTGDVAATGPGTVAATIQPGVVTGAKIASGTVTGTNIASGTVTGTNIASGTVANSNLANTTSGDSYKGRIGAAGVPADNAWSNCNGNNSALQYTNGTGTGCNSAVASLTATGQTLSGGATAATVPLGTISSGTVTINCGSGPLQSGTNNGAFTLAAPASDSSCIVTLTNGATAGAITFSGFSVGSNTGDTLTTTNTQKFSIFVWRNNSIAGYRVAAHQ